MDVKKKLVELIDSGSGCPDGMNPFDDSCESCRYKESNICHLESLADHLIANGVTVADGKDTDVPDNNVGNKWIPVTERLPDKGKVVLALGKRHATSGMFQGTSKYDPKLWHWRGGMLKEVTHWMPLPEPPKGEQNG